MTERKPPGLTWEGWIDRQIRVAIERGEFDNLPGAGRPIEGLDQPRDELWWVKQLFRREGLSLTPTTIALRKAREELLERLPALPTEAAVRHAVDELNAHIRQANRMPTDGPPSTLMPIEIDRAVQRWQDARAEPAEPARAGHPPSHPVP